MTRPTSSQDTLAHDIIDHLEQATGLRWALPPSNPSLLRNGYHAITTLIRAPHIVRQLQEAAIAATGRPRAIVFESTGRGHAIINLPREVAENSSFTSHLHRAEYDNIPSTIYLPIVIPHPHMAR